MTPGYYDTKGNLLFDWDTLFYQEYLMYNLDGLHQCANNRLPEGILVLSEDVETIACFAFQYNKNLYGIYIPSTTTRIGAYAFASCTHLSQVAIAPGLREIHSGAFMNCQSLISIELPETLIEIGEEAFSKTSLFTVTIPNSVKRIRDRSFSCNKNLNTVKLSEQMLLIPIGCFQDCPELRTVEMQSKIQVIDTDAFNGCTHLYSIRLPKSVVYIATRAFKGCAKLASKKDFIRPDIRLDIDIF